MSRNFGIGILVLCFGSSAVNLVRAAEVFQVPPIIVQPYGIQELNGQVLDRDRQNRDQEIAIQGMIEENNKLTQDVLARRKDEGLKKINQAMRSYRNALYARDQARIMANSEKGYSHYDELIALTEDVNATTGLRGDLENKSGLLAEKFQMLTELKNEMAALNEKIKGEEEPVLNQKEKIIEGYQEIVQKQQGRIQMLVEKLDDMDQKISRFDEIIAQKDRQITQLKNNLAGAQKEASSKEESIRWLNRVLAVTKNKAEYYQLTSQQDQLTVELLKSELENQIIAMKKAIQSGQEAWAQSDQMTLMVSDYQKKLESKNNAYNEQLRQMQMLSSKNDLPRMQGQIADLSARLQEKEAQVVKIKKDMYDLQKTMSAKDRETEAKDLSLSVALALERQKPNGTLGRDEINSLRARLEKAALQLKQKDEMILQLEERSAKSSPHENNNVLSKGDRLQEKLKQALDEIAEEGRVIDVLTRKLQDDGQSVNLAPYFTKS